MELKYQLLSILAFPLFGWLYKNIPVNGYFKCNDPSLSFKIPESGETIPTKLLFQSVLIPVFFVVSESILVVDVDADLILLDIVDRALPEFFMLQNNTQIIG